MTMYTYSRSLELRNFAPYLEKDITYINHNRLIYSDGKYYVDETDNQLNTTIDYYKLDQSSKLDYHGFITRHFYIDTEYNDYDIEVWPSYKLNEAFCDLLQELYAFWHIPPMITIREDSSISLMNQGNGITACHIHLEGMMSPSKTFSDYQLFAPYLVTGTGLVHCITCGWLYDGYSQCDCSWRNGWDEVDAQSYYCD